MRQLIYFLLLVPGLVLADCHHYSVVLKNMTSSAWEIDPVSMTNGKISHIHRIIAPKGISYLDFDDDHTRVDAVVTIRKQSNPKKLFKIRLVKKGCVNSFLLSDSGEVDSGIVDGGYYIRLLYHIQPNVKSNTEAVSVYEIYND